MSAGLEPINTIIALAGVILGSSSLFIYWWKRHTRTFTMFDLLGYYSPQHPEAQGLSEIAALVKVGFCNGSDETVSVTDIFATLKYNKERYNAIIAKGIIGIEEVFSVKPINLGELIPFSILPHETVKKELIIKFPPIYLDAIHRFPILNFLGFLEGSNPLYFHSNEQAKKNWNKTPPIMLLTVHVNAKKEFKRFIPLFKKGETTPSGTFLLEDVKKTEKEFLENY
jgi:hypothetical protein